MVIDRNKAEKPCEQTPAQIGSTSAPICVPKDCIDSKIEHLQESDGTQGGSKRASFFDSKFNTRFSLDGFLDPRRESDLWPGRFSFGSCSPKKVGKLVRTWGRGLCRVQPYMQNFKFILAVAKWMVKLLKIFLLYKMLRWLKGRLKLFLFSKAFVGSLRESCTAVFRKSNISTLVLKIR
eukprot:761439-Hanusia_phi.AAC.2